METLIIIVLCFGTIGIALLIGSLIGVVLSNIFGPMFYNPTLKEIP
jgi:hypothetical protein